MRLDLILLMRDIYINSKLNPLIKFTSRSTEFKDILPWNISKFPIKFPDVNLEYDGKTGNNSTLSFFLNNLSINEELSHPILSVGVDAICYRNTTSPDLF